MNSVLLHGRASWDRGYFPNDELEERLALVQAAMRAQGLRGLLVGGSFLDYANLCYLTQYIPWAGWAMAVVPVEGEITLVTGVGGGRELPVARPRTWVADVRNPANLDHAFRQVLTERGVAGRVGTVSIETLGPRLQQRLIENLQGIECVAADSLLAGQRLALRSRELSAVKVAAGVVNAAAEALRRAYENNVPNTAALVEAEFEARRLGALDFRGLVNQDESCELAPVEEQTPFKSDEVVAYLAVNCMGYWADLGVNLADAPAANVYHARAAVRGMAAAARTGARTGELAAVAADDLGPAEFAQAEAWGLGGGIGLALHSQPAIVTGGQEELVPDMALTLRVRLPEKDGPGLLVSDLVRVTDEGGISLLSC
ncbi:MAG: M24 family metallopeptidase [Chloroflexota bacterium]